MTWFKAKSGYAWIVSSRSQIALLQLLSRQKFVVYFNYGNNKFNARTHVTHSVVISRQVYVMVHQKQTHTHLHVKEHDGYDGPLGGFVDDVCVGEPAVDRT